MCSLKLTNHLSRWNLLISSGCKASVLFCYLNWCYDNKYSDVQISESRRFSSVRLGVIIWTVLLIYCCSVELTHTPSFVLCTYVFWNLDNRHKLSIRKVYQCILLIMPVSLEALKQKPNQSQPSKSMPKLMFCFPLLVIFLKISLKFSILFWIKQLLCSPCPVCLKFEFLVYDL